MSSDWSSINNPSCRAEQRHTQGSSQLSAPARLVALATLEFATLATSVHPAGALPEVAIAYIVNMAVSCERCAYPHFALRDQPPQLEVQSNGFIVYRAQIYLTTDSPVASLDVALEIEGVAQTVEVTADALATETSSTQLGESLDTKKIEGVPINGRSFADLMALQPGIVPQNTAQLGEVIMTGVASTPPSGDANPGDLSISGQRVEFLGLLVV